MTTNTDIKFYVNTNVGAPALSDAWGSIIDVLDACLVDGFGAQVVSSLTADGKTATVTFGTAHKFLQHQVIKITGANQTEFNGEYRIQQVPTTSTLVFELNVIPSTSIATGTISCSLPPLGWQKKFSGTHKAVYKGQNGLDPMFLRVDASLPDGYTPTWAKSAKITVSDGMSDVDTFTGIQMPYNASNPNLNHIFSNSRNGWFKWPYSIERSTYYGIAKVYFSEAEGGKNAATRWMVVGTDELFFIIPRIQTYNDVVHVFGFGKVKSLLNGTDNYALWVNEYSNNVYGQVYYEAIDTLAGVGPYQPNCYLFFDKTGLPNYKRVQHFTTAVIANGANHGFVETANEYSGTNNVLKPYSETGAYFGFDVIGFSESLPAFKLPHIKAMLQVGSQFSIFADGFMTIRTVEIASGAPCSYLVNVLGE